MYCFFSTQRLRLRMTEKLIRATTISAVYILNVQVANSCQRYLNWQLKQTQLVVNLKLKFHILYKKVSHVSFLYPVLRVISLSQH